MMSEVQLITSLLFASIISIGITKQMRSALYQRYTGASLLA